MYFLFFVLPNLRRFNIISGTAPFLICNFNKINNKSIAGVNTVRYAKNGSCDKISNKRRYNVTP
jgi:hypothetical protein